VAAEDLLLFNCSLFAFFIAALLSPAAAAATAAQCSASEEVMRMTVLVTLGMVAIKRIKKPIAAWRFE
jgi:hypothetical protein